MTIKITDDTVVITNTHPDTEVMFRYRPESGRVAVGTAGQTGTAADMEMLIAALQSIKTTQDNAQRRKR